MKPLYSLTLPGNSTVEISHDELRSILGDIENELHRSKVYRRAMAILQKMLGDSADQAKQLFKVVGREAIGLTFQHFAQHQATQTETIVAPVIGEAAATQTEIQTNATTTPIAEVDANHNSVQFNSVEINSVPASNDLAECLTGGKFQTINPLSTNSKETAKTSDWFQWLKQSKKLTKAELEQQATLVRTEILQQIGQQLKQARESQSLNLHQLQVYTHIPIRQMEAVENGNWEGLPEEVYVRGFIRVMANALGLNGTNLAASLPTSANNSAIALLETKKGEKSRGLSVDVNINPMHLYFGYTAVVAGAVGSLSLYSQYTEAQKLVNPESDASKAPSMKQSLKDEQPNSKPGLQSSSNGITVGSDISPPEAL